MNDWMGNETGNWTWMSVKWTAATDTVSINNRVALLIQKHPKEIYCVFQVVLCKNKKLGLMWKHTAGAEYASDYLVFTEKILTITKET